MFQRLVSPGCISMIFNKWTSFKRVPGGLVKV